MAYASAANKVALAAAGACRLRPEASACRKVAGKAMWVRQQNVLCPNIDKSCQHNAAVSGNKAVLLRRDVGVPRSWHGTLSF